MTASEPRGHPSDGERSLPDLALDLLVYLPAGVMATALDDMDQMAAKGRARVDQQVRNAQVVGRLAVDFGLRRMKRQTRSFLAARAARPQPGTPAPRAETPAARPPRPTRSRVTPSPAHEGRSAATGAHHPRDPEVDRAIPDYDALSASQVVRRLDGLDTHELRAIVRHELANRGRRTILHRAEQLLEGRPPPATGPPEAS